MPAFFMSFICPGFGVFFAPMATEQKPKTQAEVAEQWAKFTVNAWQTKIEKLKIGNTGELLRSFVHDMVLSANGDVAKIQFAFKYYGKFVDMGVGKGVKIGDVKESATSRRLEGKMLGNRRRPKKWYTKTLAHETKRLMEILMDEYKSMAQTSIVENIESM